jgi:autotransporter translocation and assembly factor TamB
MGVGGAALVTAPLARALGLDTLDVVTGATVDDTRIQLGKMVSPRLSLRSGYNPFDQLWTFIVNYRLSERWALEAQTGAANSAADIIYSVETDDPREIRNLWR